MKMHDMQLFENLGTVLFKRNAFEGSLCSLRLHLLQPKIQLKTVILYK